MTYPETVREELNGAIDAAIKMSEEYLIDSSRAFTRKRVLTQETMIKTLLFMNGGSLNKELYSSGLKVSAPSFCRRRQKILSSTFEDVFHTFNAAHPDTQTVNGYRLFACDGTTISMARNPQSSTFLWDGNKGYSAFHLTPIYDAISHTWFDAAIQPQPKMDEIGALTYPLKWNNIPNNSIILLDRGFESYNMLANLLNTPNLDFVLRIKQNKGAMREVQKLPMTELYTEVTQVITTTQTNEDKRENRIFLQTGSKKGKVNSASTRLTRWEFPSPFPLTFRVVRYRLPENGDHYYTLAKSLSKDQFSAEEVKELYGKRWQC